jgi:hypothetical protein
VVPRRQGRGRPSRRRDSNGQCCGCVSIRHSQEDAIPEQHSSSTPQVSRRLHPFVYKAVVGLALWFALAAWVFFGTADTELMLAIVTLFIVVAIGIPYILSAQIGQREAESDPGRPDQQRFGDWLSGEFDTADRIKAANAAVEIILPIAAVAVGITALGIILHVVGSVAV